MQYEEHPNSQNTPSRKSRKSARNKVFITNAGLGAKKRREKKAARRAAEEAAAETEE